MYVELNPANYTDEEVAHLNEWGIWAYGEIDRQQAEIERLRAALKSIATEGETTFASPDGFKGVADAVGQELARVRNAAHAALVGETSHDA